MLGKGGFPTTVEQLNRKSVNSQNRLNLMNNSATTNSVEFCLFSEEFVRNLIASLYLHLHLDFICTDLRMLVKGKFPGVVEQLNVKSTNSKKFLN